VRTQPVALETLDGVHLAGDLAEADDARAVVVLAHPHPQYGGTRHVPVIDHLFRALPGHGLAAIRFDFRGAGESGGEHDAGVNERLDVLAALEFAELVVPAVAIVLLGYSFGAGVVLDVIDPRVAGWVAVAPQARPAMLAGSDHRPKLLAVPSHDQFCPPDAARTATEQWRSTELAEIPSADHFLAGALSRVAELAARFAAEVSG
jgi:alpha/beta superfamily hydrolase